MESCIRNLLEGQEHPYRPLRLLPLGIAGRCGELCLRSGEGSEKRSCERSDGRLRGERLPLGQVCRQRSYRKHNKTWIQPQDGFGTREPRGGRRLCGRRMGCRTEAGHHPQHCPQVQHQPQDRSGDGIRRDSVYRNHPIQGRR